MVLKPGQLLRAGPLGWEGARCWLQGRLFPGRGAFRHSQQVAPLHHAATRNCQACHGCVSRQGALRECSGCVRAASEMGLATNCSHRSFENSSAQRTSILEEQSRQTLQRASSKYFPVGAHGLCFSYSALPLWPESCHRHGDRIKRPQLCSRETLFTKLRFGSLAAVCQPLP